MGDSSSDSRATADEILRLQQALRTRYPSDPQGVQDALEKLHARATALLGSAETDAHEAIEFEFYDLVESAPEIHRVFHSVVDTETAEILRRAIENLQRLQQDRALTQHELENLRASQSLYDDLTRRGDDEASK